MRLSGAKSGWIAALVVALGMATAASAVVLKGRGELVAYGNGLAVLELRGGANLRGLGVLIVEPDVRVEVQGNGRRSFLDDGRILYEGFGRAAVRSPGRPTRIEVAGAGLWLHARGIGRAFLKGVGGFHTDDVDGTWGPDTEIELEGPLED